MFKCARLLNERALGSLPTPPTLRPRAAHLALFPHIELQGGTRITDLATKVGTTKQAVGQLIDELERQGAVERLPDPDDRRAKRVQFTDAGKASILAGLSHLRGIERELARAIGRDTMASLHTALLALHDHLEDRAPP